MSGTAEPGHTIVVQSADERGVPLTAACRDCGWFWARPPGDTDGGTLSVAANWHVVYPPAGPI